MLALGMYFRMYVVRLLDMECVPRSQDLDSPLLGHFACGYLRPSPVVIGRLFDLQGKSENVHVRLSNCIMRAGGRAKPVTTVESPSETSEGMEDR